MNRNELYAINKKVKVNLAEADRIQERLTADISKDLIRNYKRALDDIKQKLSDLYERLINPDNYYADAYKENRLNNLRRQIEETLSALKLKEAHFIESGIKDSFASSYYNTSQGLEKSLGVSLNLNTLPKGAIENIVNNPLSQIRWQDSSVTNILKMTADVRDELIQGLIQGNPYGQTARAITEKMNIGASKAYRIVSTEIGRAQNEARIKSFDVVDRYTKEIGLKPRRVWLHMPGAKEPRPDHIQMNGKAADDSGYFTLPDGTKTKAPRTSGKPEHDIFCHCAVVVEFTNL